MRILAIETTEAVGSVAAMADGQLLTEHLLSAEQRSARSLAPGMLHVLKSVGWRPSDVQLVAVTTGPGSFTGLRVGVTAAKTLAYAVGAEAMGIDTLEAIAAGMPPAIDRVAVAVDAQRGEVVAATFRRNEEGWFEVESPPSLLAAERWLAELPAGMAIAGPILARWASRVPAGLTLVDAQWWPPRAGQVARLAHRDYAAGRRDDFWRLSPRYSRRAAAEEKWDQRHGDAPA